MKRKLNLVGNNTLTVSLPSKWTKKYNLNKGDEIDLEEIGPELRINFSKNNIKKQITINLDEEVTTYLVWRYIKSAYISGYDTIIISFKTEKIKYTSKGKTIGQKSDLMPINDLMHSIGIRFFGMVIVDQNHNKFILKDLGTSDELDVKGIFKKVFSQVKTLSETVKEVADTRNKENFANVLALENNINRLTDYGLRILNKRNKNEEGDHNLHFILETLESIGDSFYDIFEQVIKQNLELTEESKNSFNKLVILFNNFYETYLFKKKNLILVHNESKKLNLELDLNPTNHLNIKFKLISDLIKSSIGPELIKLCETKLVEED